MGETGAYRYEMRLAERFGFSAEYNTYLREMLDAHKLPASLVKKIQRSPTWRRIHDAVAK